MTKKGLVLLNAKKAGMCLCITAPSWARDSAPLAEGQKVEFTVVQGAKGPAAEEVSSA